MTMPSVGNYATALYEAVNPLAADDASYGYALLHLCESIGVMFEDVYNWIIEDEDETRPGWSILLDLDNAPEDALDWLGQFKGARLVSSWDAADKRAYIASTDGFDRGRPAAIIAAVQLLLTGTKTVTLRERYDPGDPLVDSPGYLYVQTLTSETPDAAAVQALLDEDGERAIIPAGIIAIHEDVAARDYDDLDADYASYTAVDTAYASYTELLEDV